MSLPAPQHARHLSHQAVHYALSREPSSVGEFANYFEFYVADFNRHSLKLRSDYFNEVDEFIAARGASSQAEIDAIRREISLEMFGEEITATTITNRRLRNLAATRVQAIMGEWENRIILDMLTLQGNSGFLMRINRKLTIWKIVLEQYR